MDTGWIQLGIVAVTIVFSAGGAWVAVVLGLKHLKARVKTLEGQLTEKLAANRSADEARETHYDDVRQELEGKISSLETRLAEAVRDMQSLQNKVGQGTAANAEASKQLDQLWSVVRGIQDELTGTKKDLQILQEGIATRLKYIEKAETAVNELVMAQGQMKTKLDRAEKDIATQESSSRALADRVATIEGGCRTRHGTRG